MPAGKAHSLYEFDRFRLDPTQGQLLDAGRPVALTPKAVETLTALVERSGRIVGRNELMDAVWPGAFVEEAVLTQNVYTLRRALGSAGDRPLIETVRGRGYRLTVPVRRLPDPVPAVASIAVLPFEPLGIAEEGEILGLALADALITRLGGARGLVVRPTHAVRSFVEPGLDPLEVARRLRVDAVVTGTLRRSGSRLRIGAQLVREGASSPLWAGQADATESDLFGAEDELLNGLLEALGREPTSAGAAHPSRAAASHEAHHAYLRGRFFWNKRAGEDLDRAISYFERAITLDPEYALAYAGLADAYVLLPFYTGAAPSESFPLASEAAARALALDERLAEAHTSLAYTRFFYDWEWEAAERGFARALELRPSYATAHHWRGFSWSALGRADAAIAELERALDLDPLSLVIHADLGLACYFARRYSQAVGHLEAALELDATFAYADFGLCLTRCAERRFDDAIAAARRAVAHASPNQAMRAVLGHALAIAGDKKAAEEVAASLHADPRANSSHLALLYAGLGPAEVALEWTAKAIEDRSRFVLFLGVWPVFDSLRWEPTFERLVGGVGLPAGS